MPGMLVASVGIRFALDHVVPSTAARVLTIDQHLVGGTARYPKKFAIAGQVIESRQAPGNLEVVTDHGAILLPGVGQVGFPVGIKALKYEGACRVGEVRGNQRAQLVHAPQVFRLAGAQVKILQIGR